MITIMRFNDNDDDVHLHGEEVLGGSLPLLLSLFRRLPPAISAFLSYLILSYLLLSYLPPAI